MIQQARKHYPEYRRKAKICRQMHEHGTQRLADECDARHWRKLMREAHLPWSEPEKRLRPIEPEQLSLFPIKSRAR